MSQTLPSKWCPQCRDEFVHAMTRCPECEVDLVDELPAAGEAAGEAAASHSGWIRGWADDVDKRAEEAQAARSEWNEAESCPACQTPMSPDAAECPECGLVFVEADG